MKHLRFLAIVFVLCLTLTACPTRRHLKPGTVATFAGIQFVWCPPGYFVMGQDLGVDPAGVTATPEHIVIFVRGFWLSRYEITQQQWHDVMNSDPSEFAGSNQPVEMVSWDDAQSFVDVLNSATAGSTFRLPSESEWEYACRAGTKTRYYWGDDLGYTQVDNYAWYHDNSDLVTHNVGQKLPNAWGLYDMSGNVWEWVQDRFHMRYDGAPYDGSAWETEEPGTGHNRVVRGGAYNYENYHCESASRGVGTHDTKHSDIGFRIVRY